MEQKFEKSGKIITRETREDRRSQLEAAKQDYSNEKNTQQNTSPSNKGEGLDRPSFDTSKNLSSSENKNGPGRP